MYAKILYLKIRREGDNQMNKRLLAKLCRSILILLLTVSMLLGAVPASNAQDGTYKAGAVRRLDGVVPDYMDYVDDSVLFQLPDSIKPEDEISVIITVDVISLLDAYEKTDKTISLSAYVLSDEAAQIQSRIDGRKAEILSALDELGVAYTTGQDYETLLAGFELILQASDFEAACKALGEGEDAIVGEVTRPPRLSWWKMWSTYSIPAFSTAPRFPTTAPVWWWPFWTPAWILPILRSR